MFLIIAVLIISAVALFCLALLPFFQEKAKVWQIKKEKQVFEHLEKLYYDKSPQEIMRLYIVMPIAFSVLGIIFLKNILFVIPGILLGVFIPNFILKIREARYRQKFDQQILSAIMLLSSSLKGGLSLLQAFEILVEEMPVPMSQEMGLMVRENKMGISLEESLQHLNDRMKMEELTLVINSILVARETGGDLTKVFSRLTTTIRDNKKLKDNVRTLTLQGRMQGIIMSLLPFMFVGWVLTFNKGHFDIMLQSEIGRVLLFVAAILQILGMFLIKIFSTINI